MKRTLSAWSILSALSAMTLVILYTADPASALQRSPRSGAARPPADGGGSGRAVPKGGGSSGGGTNGATSTPKAKGEPASTPQAGGSGSGSSTGPTRERPVPTSGRSPNDGTVIAQAAPRARGNSGGTTVVIPNGYHGGFYPWGYGGYGFGGYNSGYYDPWFYGGYGYPRSSYSYSYDGQLRIKVKPRDATVLVDGYYVGRVDDFDGIFQRLRVEPGAHRIEIRADGYEPLAFDIRLEPGRTITYEGDLERQP